MVDLSTSYWQILAAIWLFAGMAMLYMMDRAEKQDGDPGRFAPLNFANVMTIVAVLSFWPVLLVAHLISQRRRARGDYDDESLMWKAVLIVAAPFIILFIPVILLAFLFGLARRAVRRLRGIDPAAGAPRMLRIPAWPSAEEERDILARLAGMDGMPPALAALRETPEARLLDLAWVYVGLRLARMEDDAALARMEEGRGATHGGHPRHLRDYLQWRLGQDDPGGPQIDPDRFPEAAATAVYWACDRFEEPSESEFEPPDHLEELQGPESAARRPAETALLRLLMQDGGELYRCIGEDGNPAGVLLIRGGYAVAHLQGDRPGQTPLAMA